ncbi:MAG: tRNA (adenosine(37)-N6)-threonylcarbamoyltransferase complex ATPase subunit type 1 TsaE [Ferruginibacter sp.]
MTRDFHLSELPETARWLLENTAGSRCFALYGEMGAGKTTLVHALCAVLQVRGNVSSPTFSIIQEYAGDQDQPVYHLDLYRVSNEAEAVAAGVLDCIDHGDYCFIEWPERLEGLLGPDVVRCRLSVTGDQSRRLVISR